MSTDEEPQTTAALTAGAGIPAAADEIIRARLAAVVTSSSDAIIAKDLNSVITDWNPAAERMFGYTADEAIGRDIRMLIPERLVDEEVEIIRRIRANERIESYETTRKHKDGQLLQVSLTVSPILNAHGEVVGASKIARDITAAKQNERSIRVLLREINHRVKNQYAVILSLIRETGERTESIPEFQQKIRERITSLAASHDLLVQTEWSGSALIDLVEAQLEPFTNRRTVTILGPRMTVSSNAVQALGMAMHELGTNSSKYGVLSGRPGHIDIVWNLSLDDVGEQQFMLSWDEKFDVPLSVPPKPSRGFGTVVLQRITPSSLDGTATMDIQPGGLTWTLRAPATSLSQDVDTETTGPLPAG